MADFYFFYFRLFEILVYKIGFCIVNNFKKKKKHSKKKKKEINQRFDKIIAITKTSSILSQWTYFSSQTFQKIQCNVSDTFVLNYYLLQTLTKVSINLRDRRKVSVIKLVFIENQEKLETYYIFGIIVKDHKFSRFFKINFRHKTNFLQRFLS